ncbi:hypothetical protein PR202_ga13965 [Eleusine coracana subsp. coracana]|uniref:BP28 C-terminal domain-containing protein n=1 Tax=Eleusine coracana subsp. coracana TaxID=191504 RepID=A0AAV5CG75_ELECO|nr:hypothetical protein PR202_ga13965 [Eleusine coracana subsp. coracana]
MSSIAAQLQAIKSAAGSAPEPARRSITRPSVFFDAKEAADIDLRAILPIALSGLEHLASVDERFARYSNTLFSETSLEVNREQLTPKENEKINESISTYLRLLAGYLQLLAALKTLEYLIRRYLVHVYNLDELLLSALPYHDTHAFVRIVQLINLGNSKWTFLGGVKSSGAPPPRSFLVQQCIRDKAMLETLCNYVTPTKDFNHSRTVVCFRTAVIVECLGAVLKLDIDIVQRVLGFVFDSLNPAVTRDQDYKAGALMIVGILATRATLGPKLVQNLIFFVARTAQHDSFDLPWLRVTVMAIISLVQLQAVHDLPKKALMILKDISTSDDSCHTHLIEAIETLPLKNSVERIVFKVLGNCNKVSRATDNPDMKHTGKWARRILSVIERKYPLELHDAIRKFLEKHEINPMGGGSMSVVFSLVFDESDTTPTELQHLVQSGTSKGGSKASKASDIAISCLEKMVLEYQSHRSGQGHCLSSISSPYCSFKVLGKQVSLCQACLPALKDEWCHIQPKDDGAGSEINIDKLEKCNAELLKHIFNSDSEALNAKILLCIFWAILRVHSSYIKQDSKDIRSSAVKCIEGLSFIWQRMSTSLQRNGNNIKLPLCMSSPTFGMFLESLLSQKTMISSDARFLPAYISSMLSPHKDMMVPDNLHERFDQPTKDSLLHFILRSAMKLSPYGKFMALSVLKGVGSTLFQAEDVKSLFFNLLDRRDQYWNRHYSVPLLSTYEIQILCLFLEVLFSKSDCANIDFKICKALLSSLRVDVLSPDNPIVVMPCVTVLQTLQLVFFDELKTDIKVHASTVVKFIDLIVALDGTKGHPKRVKRQEDWNQDAFNNFEEFFGENAVASILVSLLDILFLKKDVNQRSNLLQPLFQILSKLLTDQWVSGIVCQYNEQHDISSETPDFSSSVKEAQQLVLLVLKDITGCNVQQLKYTIAYQLCLVSQDVGTQNHGFSLIASVAKACPELVSESMVDLFVAIGDAIKQDDSHSQRVLEDLLSVVVPCWLSRTTSIEKLLQIFIKALADISEHRRLTLMVYLLRTLGTESSLSTVIMHLFHALVERISHPSLSVMSQEWEYGLAISVTDQCSYTLWFPCLSKLLKEIRLHKRQDLPQMLHLAMRFILVKLEDTQLNFELESKEAADFIQGSLGELMEEVILCSVITKDKKRESSGDIMKEVRDHANTVLKIIKTWMRASTYFIGITQLLDHSDSVVKRKTLGILSETARGNSLVQNQQRKARKLSSLTASIKVDQNSGPYFGELCLKILVLVDRGVDSDASVKIAAISALETLAKEYPLDNPTYINCLAEIIHHIGSGDTVTSSASVRTAGALINVLGSKALPQLPLIMKNIMLGSHQVLCCPTGNYADDCTQTSARLSSQTTTMLLSVLTTIELTEATFRPLFLRSLEWADSEVDESSSRRSLDRAIVFYKLVNKLAEQHRSLFAPYFKYLLEGSVQYLLEDGALANAKQKKKKAKLEGAQVEKKDKLSGPKLWNLRALILKSLHKCFLYDNDQKILDSSNFQILLKSIVSQFVMELPESTESVLDTLSVEEVDETGSYCTVLMQTRSDKIRPKMLSLKVVRYMVQHLEEYVVLLPETIPFLGELLEDVELPVLAAVESATANVNNDDVISALGDELLLRILGLVADARDVVRTGVLSRRWRGLWTRAPVLAFHTRPGFVESSAGDAKLFVAFVGNVLARRASSDDEDIIQVLAIHMDFLDCRLRDQDDESVLPLVEAAEGWIRYAARHAVTRLFFKLRLPRKERQYHFDYEEEVEDQEDTDDGNDDVDDQEEDTDDGNAEEDEQEVDTNDVNAEEEEDVDDHEDTDNSNAEEEVDTNDGNVEEEEEEEEEDTNDDGNVEEEEVDNVKEDDEEDQSSEEGDDQEIEALMIDLTELSSSPKLKTMTLDLDSVSVRLPSTAVFTSLTDLKLEFIELADGSGLLLSRLLSSACCPCLQTLRMLYVDFKHAGTKQLSIDVDALLNLSLKNVEEMESLELRTPNLLDLQVEECEKLTTLTVSATRLEKLACLRNSWELDVCGDFPSVWRLNVLLCSHLFSYDSINETDICLLQRCSSATDIRVDLEIPSKIERRVDLITDKIPQLPHVTSLEVHLHPIITERHSIGDGVAGATDLRKVIVSFSAMYRLEDRGKEFRHLLLGDGTWTACCHEGLSEVQVAHRLTVSAPELEELTFLHIPTPR